MPVVSLVKGLEQGTNFRMSQIVDEVLPGHPAGILAGPNIAREVAEGYAAAAVLAMPDQHLAADSAELFRTKRFRTYTTDDVVGVEMAGALKNVYAIAVGMGYSLGIGENTRAMVIARAVREMSKLGEAIGGQRDTFAGLAGMGDLIVTCTSQRSRNRHVGEQLGAGKPIDEIIASMNQVAEGVKAASVIMEFADKYGINMPIAREVDAVINHGVDRRAGLPRAGRREARPRGARLGLLDRCTDLCALTRAQRGLLHWPPAGRGLAGCCRAVFGCPVAWSSRASRSLHKRLHVSRNKSGGSQEHPVNLTATGRQGIPFCVVRTG